jgi:hypothetical protein
MHECEKLLTDYKYYIDALFLRSQTAAVDSSGRKISAILAPGSARFSTRLSERSVHHAAHHHDIQFSFAVAPRRAHDGFEQSVRHPAE